MSKDNAVSLAAPESGAISDPLTELPRRELGRGGAVALFARDFDGRDAGGGLGAAAAGLSSNVVARLKRGWWDEYHAWKNRGLDDDWVYLWADGIHSGLRGDGGRLCALMVIGVNARGEKHFPAIGDGVRESARSWREVCWT